MHRVIFDIDSVCFSYKRQKVLDGICLDIEAGTFYSMLGPNGCGKTTFLDVMMGNRSPESGKIRYLGRDIGRYDRKELAREVSLVPQDFYIHLPFTIWEVVLMGRHPYIPRFGTPSEEDIQIAERVMRDTGLYDLRNKYITELSGGERQRVVFARALVQDTPVLILDEATSNMDIQYTLAFLGYVSRAVKTGKTVISTFHDINLAATYSDKMVFMKAGRVISVGDTQDVLTEENIRQTFGVESRVYFDQYSGRMQVGFTGGS